MNIHESKLMQKDSCWMVQWVNDFFPQTKVYLKSLNWNSNVKTYVTYIHFITGNHLSIWNLVTQTVGGFIRVNRHVQHIWGVGNGEAWYDRHNSWLCLWFLLLLLAASSGYCFSIIRLRSFSLVFTLFLFFLSPFEVEKISISTLKYIVNTIKVSPQI